MIKFMSDSEKDTRSFEQLVAGLYKDCNWDTDTVFSDGLIKAIKGLGKLGDINAIPHLTPHLPDVDIQVRAAALEAIGKLSDQKVLPYFLPFLTHSNTSARGYAIEGLIQLGEVQAIPHLLPMLQDYEKVCGKLL